MIRRCLIAFLVVAVGLTALGPRGSNDASVAAADTPRFTNIGVVVSNGTAIYYLCFAAQGPPLAGAVNITDVNGNQHQAGLAYNNQTCTIGSSIVGFQVTAAFAGLASGAYTFRAVVAQSPDGLPIGLTPGASFESNFQNYTVATSCSVNFAVNPDSPIALQGCNPVSGAYGAFGGPPPVPTSTPTATNTASPTSTSTPTNTPVPPSATPTLTNTPAPSPTRTSSRTATVSPTGQPTNVTAPPTNTPAATGVPSVTPTAMTSANAPPPPRTGAYHAYFAEGYTGLGYQEYLSLLNPQTQHFQAHILIQQMNGVVHVLNVNLSALARRTLNLNALTPHTSTALEVDATGPIVAERAEYHGNGQIVAGAAAPRRLWYVPEGYVGSGFSDGLRVFNPQTVPAVVTITAYQSNGMGHASRWTVASGTRVNMPLNDIAPWGGSALVIRASVPLVVESVVNTARTSGPSGALALPAPSRTWYFPDGGTSAGNDEYITVFNPNARTVPVRLRPVTADGYQPPITFRVPPHTRAVLTVQGLIRQPGLAAEVDADRPIVAQEVRYTARGGMTVVNGAPQAGRAWGLADGYVGHGFQEWVTLFNPRTTWATVRVRLMGPHGVRVVTLHESPRGRDYLSVSAFVPVGPVAVLAQASHPVVIGRTLIFNNGKGLSTTTGVLLHG